jgi:hypothetical protein
MDVGRFETSLDAPPSDVVRNDGIDGGVPRDARDASSSDAPTIDASTADRQGTDAPTADVGMRDVKPAVCSEPTSSIDPSTGHCYFVTPGTANWALSRNVCTSLGTHLVTIASATEQTFVANWLATVGGAQKDLWIGLSQSAAAPFTWVTGEPVVFTNWGAGEPNDGPDACGRIQAGGAWADWALCDGKFAGLCEREP